MSKKDMLTLISGLAAIVCFCCAVAGVIFIYAAIWGDPQYWGRWIATAGLTACVTVAIGVSTHHAVERMP